MTTTLLELMSREEKFDSVRLRVLCRVERVINDRIESLLNLGKITFQEVRWKLEGASFILKSFGKL